MNEIETFFRSVSSLDRTEEQFYNNLFYIAVSEWHITPNELMEIEIPVLYILLNKRKEHDK